MIRFLAILSLCFTLGCSKSTSGPETEKEQPEVTDFELVDEWDGPYEQSDVINVNAGNSAEKFVEAAYWQVFGQTPEASYIQNFSQRLINNDYFRRIDVVNSLLQASARTGIEIKYSDPWKKQVELKREHPGVKKTSRDIGAVFMFFFNTPGGTNGKMSWANTHAPGMDIPSAIMKFNNSGSGYYNPKDNPGFWYRELMDAQYAGLDFLLLNTYGPDLSDGSFEMLNSVLSSPDITIKLALFDDTWTWGEPWFGAFWETIPDLAKTEEAANTLYTAKWKPFFQKIPRAKWYLFHDKPVIYFYNAGKLLNRSKTSGVIQKMKAHFLADFDVEPFVILDTAYFIDSQLNTVADGRFTWYTFNDPDQKSRYTMNGVTIDHAMVKWDPLGRDNPGQVSQPSDFVVKGPEILEKILNSSLDADLLILATWNDLGEGTGINRNYDYYHKGEWLRADYFMNLIWNSQFD